MAMPAIGTGVFKFPPELAAEIIVKALLTRAAEYADITLVRICVGDVQMKAVFQTALDAALEASCRCALNFDHPCALNFDQGWLATFR